MPALGALLWLMLQMFLTPSALGQLTELSAGDTVASWRQAQLEAIRQQLDAGGLGRDLAAELRAQQQWLTRWQPSSLTDAPLWEAEEASRLNEEPILDPNGLASNLRQRLLRAQARPTVDDTEELKRMLAEHRNDIGVRQLHLHWLDQLQYRKQYAESIAKAASELEGLFSQVTPQTERLKWARAFTLYRRGRALAYRELPDVVAEDPIDDPDAHAAMLYGTYKQLVALIGQGRPEFVLLEDRILRRDGWHGRALKLLEQSAAVIDKKWFLKKRRDLLQELEWKLPYEEAAEIYAKHFPEEVAKELAGDADGE